MPVACRDVVIHASGPLSMYGQPYKRIHAFIWCGHPRVVLRVVVNGTNENPNPLSRLESVGAAGGLVDGAGAYNRPWTPPVVWGPVPWVPGGGRGGRGDAHLEEGEGEVLHLGVRVARPPPDRPDHLLERGEGEPNGSRWIGSTPEEVRIPSSRGNPMAFICTDHWELQNIKF